MVRKDEDPSSAATPKGKHWVILICWLLGNGCLFAFNSMLTTLDYYIYLFPAEKTPEPPPQSYTGTQLAAVSYGASFYLCFDLGRVKGFFSSGLQLLYLLQCRCGLVCAVLYAFVFPKLSIVNFYRSQAASDGSLTVTADLAAAGIQRHSNLVSLESPACVERLSTNQLLHQNKDYILDMFLIYLLTFAILPGFLAEDTGSHSMGSWYGIVLIACTYTWDLIASYIPLIGQIKLTSRKWLLIAVVSRFLLIPAFYYTSKHGSQGWMILLTSFLGLSHGYLAVCVITEAPKGYKDQNKMLRETFLRFSFWEAYSLAPFSIGCGSLVKGGELVIWL